MRLFTLLEFRLEELPVIEPLCIEYITIHIIVKDTNLLVILRVEDKRFIIIEGIMAQCFTYNSRQTLTTVAHIDGLGTEIESHTVAEQDHGYDIFSSSIATTDKLVLFISTVSPVGDWRTSCSTCHSFC